MLETPQVRVGDKVSYVLGVDKSGWEKSGHGTIVSISDGGDTVFVRTNGKYVSLGIREVRLIKEKKDG